MAIRMAAIDSTISHFEYINWKQQKGNSKAVANKFLFLLNFSLGITIIAILASMLLFAL